MKWLLRQLAGHFGYEIRKAPLRNYQAAQIFDLAVHYLMSTVRQPLTFIQVGANDGQRFGDPMRKFIVNYRWTGVLVEPQPDIFEALKLNYAGFEHRVWFENIAISRESDPMPLYRLPSTSPLSHDSRSFASSVASPSRRITARQLGISKGSLETILVPTGRLDDLVERYGLEDLGILQIDTEGFDWEVLQTLDLTKTRPWIIQFEHGHLSPKVIGVMTANLNSAGYLVYFGGHESDSVAMRADLLETSGLARTLGKMG